MVNPRDRLCEVVLGEKLYPRKGMYTKISIPIYYEEITADTLMAAQEAIYTFTPAHIKQVLPFILYVIEQEDTELLDTGYVDAYFIHVNYEFHSPSFENLHFPPKPKPKYIEEYRQNWIAPTLSAMNTFEHNWAYEWASSILKADGDSFSYGLKDDLVMFCRLLSMALGRAESEAPAFTAKVS